MRRQHQSIIQPVSILPRRRRRTGLCNHHLWASGPLTQAAKPMIRPASVRGWAAGGTLAAVAGVCSAGRPSGDSYLERTIASVLSSGLQLCPTGYWLSNAAKDGSCFCHSAYSLVFQAFNEFAVITPESYCLSALYSINGAEVLLLAAPLSSDDCCCVVGFHECRPRTPQPPGIALPDSSLI